MALTAQNEDKTRTIEAATGQVNERETLRLGPWEVGYLSLKNSEMRRLEAVEGSGKYGDLLDFAYPLFARRFIGDEPPSQEAFEDETDLMDIRVFIAWLNGVSEEEARKTFTRNPKAQTSEAGK